MASILSRPQCVNLSNSIFIYMNNGPVFGRRGFCHSQIKFLYAVYCRELNINGNQCYCWLCINDMDSYQSTLCQNTIPAQIIWQRVSSCLNDWSCPITIFTLCLVWRSLHWYCCISVLTHWGQDEMNNISQTTFSNEFSSIKMFEFRLRFHWSLFPRVQLTIFQHWLR